MAGIMYHPLIDADSSGCEKVPLFSAKDQETVREHHSLWLESITPSTYRIISKKPMNEPAVAELKIHCPHCGTIMDQICAPLDEHRLSIIRCMRCSKRNGG